MSFLIERHESVADATRRIAHEQLSDAVESLEELIVTDPEDAVHDARKRCKKVRGAIRLVRPVVEADTYEFVNDNLRDAARELSEERDATAMHETFAELVSSDGHAPADGVEEVDAYLARRRARTVATIGGGSPAVVDALALIEQVRNRIGEWTLDEDDWSAIAPGLGKTYKRGRSAMSRAQSSPTEEHFHQWRKRVKYTWYHLRLLALASPAMVGSLADRFHDLSELLGDAHDLRVLSEELRTAEVDPAPEHGVASTIRFLEGHRVQLERRAMGLGSRLYVEPRDAFVDRIGGYWRAWQRFGAEPRMP